MDSLRTPMSNKVRRILELHTDGDPQFDSYRWRLLLQASGIKHLDSGIERHNAIGVGEKYHDFLERIYRKVRTAHQKIRKDDFLSLSVNAMSNSP